MTHPTDDRNHFDRLIAECDALFVARRYASAYHALAAALHLAEDSRDETMIAPLSERASAHRSQYEHDARLHKPRVSVSAMYRDGRDLYKALELCIATLQLSWRLDRASRQRGHAISADAPIALRASMPRVPDDRRT